jgi:hypothetical protein
LNPLSFLLVLGLLKPVGDITKQNTFIVSDALPKLFFQEESIQDKVKDAPVIKNYPMKAYRESGGKASRFNNIRIPWN